jgi:hypothetical protein
MNHMLHAVEGLVSAEVRQVISSMELFQADSQY